MAKFKGSYCRFQRNAIEIRVLDIQECPAADLAVLKLIVSTIRSLSEGRFSKLEQQKKWEVDPLYTILKSCIKDAEEAIIDNTDYLKLFGYEGGALNAGELWQFLASKATDLSEEDMEIIQKIGKEGTLSTRISRKLNNSTDHNKLVEVYRELSNCLQENKMFT